MRIGLSGLRASKMPANLCAPVCCQDICTETTCPTMSAGSYAWQWADGDKVKVPPRCSMHNMSHTIVRQTPQQLSAPKYIEKLLVWAASLAAPDSKCFATLSPTCLMARCCAKGWLPVNLHYARCSKFWGDVEVESQLADEQRPQVVQRCATHL